MSAIKSYSEKYSKVIKLRNGNEAFLRPIKVTDDQLMLNFLKSCSYDTLFFRFMSSSIYINLKKWNTEAVMKRIKIFTNIDYEDHMSIIGLNKENNNNMIISEGIYVKSAPDRAEVAIMTADNWQRQGMATNIGEFLVEIAKSKGIKFFEGEIMLSNQKLLNLFTVLKIKYNKIINHGVLHFEINLDEPFYV